MDSTSNPVPPAQIVSDFKEALQANTDFRNRRSELRRDVLQTSAAAFVSLIDTIGCLQGMIVKAFERQQGNRWPNEDAIARRQALIASYMAGAEYVVGVTLQGDYISAAALVRQQMECVAALEELAKNRREDDETPNVSALRWKLSRAYGSLSQLTHNSVHAKLMQLLADDADVVGRAIETSADESTTLDIRFFPRFIKWKAQQLLSQQAVFALIATAHALEFVSSVTDTPIGERETALLRAMGEDLEEQQVLKRVTD